MSGWFTDAPAGLLPLQEAFLEELRHALETVDPPRIDREAVEAGMTEGGDLYARMPHAERDDLAIEAFCGERRIIVSVDPVAQTVDARVFKEPRRRARAAAGFVAALLSGFERRKTFRGETLVRVQIRVPQPDGSTHRIAARPVTPRLGSKRQEREWVSFLNGDG